MREALIRRLGLDPALLDASAEPENARNLNRDIVQRLSAAPDMWNFEPSLIRRLRLEGRGPFPLCAEDEQAELVELDGPHGRIPLRVFKPSARVSRGTYLHFHGGGWTLGSAREYDRNSRALAEATGLTVLSVDYRLGPEHPYPQGPDDCEAVARWLVSGAAGYPTGFLAIGGESAGAHLAVVTLLRMRDRHSVSPFHAVNLVAGCYDLAGTPSVRDWGPEKLILNTRDIGMFVRNFLADGGSVDSPDISPIHANLAGMPPAIFSCGTRDLLLDDTLLMAEKWRAAGNLADVHIFPGGCHVFQAFETVQAQESLDEIHGFLNRIATQDPT